MCSNSIHVHTMTQAFPITSDPMLVVLDIAVDDTIRQRHFFIEVVLAFFLFRYFPFFIASYSYLQSPFFVSMTCCAILSTSIETILYIDFLRQSFHLLSFYTLRLFK